MAKTKTREESKLVQEFEQTPVDRLTVHPKNARKGDLEAIGGSIQHNGFFGAIVAQRSTGHILVGNHRYLAARAAGIEVLPVLWVDVDDKAAKKIMLADNRTNDVASYDNQALLDLLQSLEADLDGTGYDSDALEMLIEEVHPRFEAIGSDNVPNMGEVKKSKCPECGHEFTP